MARKRLVRTTVFPYHVTGRANNREDFPLPLQKVWRILTDCCLHSTIVHSAQIHAFVLMPNHFHMLISTPASDLGVVMEDYMKSATKTCNLLSGRSGRIFGGPYHWSLIASTSYYANAYKYVYRNPVRAKICSLVQDYPFSTLSTLVGSSAVPFPVYFPFGLSGQLGFHDEPWDSLTWLNTPFLAEEESSIHLGLKKAQFALPCQKRYEGA